MPRSNRARPVTGSGLVAVALAALLLAACSSSQERALAVVKDELSAAGYDDARVLTLDPGGEQVQVVYTAKARNASESSDERTRVKELVWNVYPHKLTKITVQAVAGDTLIAGSTEADAEEMQSASGDRPPQVRDAPGPVDFRSAVALAFLAGAAVAGLVALLARALHRRTSGGPAVASPAVAAGAPAGGGASRAGWTSPPGRPEVRRPGASEPGRDHPPTR